MKKKIALIYGGDSSEMDISVKSGKNVSSYLDRELYDVYEILMIGNDWLVQSQGFEGLQIDKSDFSFSSGDLKIKFDIALIMIHGAPGENGLLQGYLEMLKIPHSTCSTFVCSLTFDKYGCKAYLRDLNILLPDQLFIKRGDIVEPDQIVAKLGLPLFVKPNDGGSSFGIAKVKRIEELLPAIEDAFKEGNSVLVEEYIAGRELTCGIYCHNGELINLPVTEIIPDNEFFDYEAKYLGASKEICPAEIDESIKQEVWRLNKAIYRHLGCRGLVRIDYILRGKDIFFLELNAVPGMTRMSLVPQQLEVAGIGMKEFLTQLIEEGRRN